MNSSETHNIKASIYICEGDIDFLSLLKNKLNSEEYLLDYFDEEYSLLHALKKKQPDLLLLDVNISGNTGLNLIKKIKRICPGIIFICIASHTDREFTVEAMKEGAHDFLFKDQTFFEILPTKLTQAISWIRHEDKLEKAERELKSSRERYVDLFENSKEAIYFSNKEGHLIDFNTSFITVFGYSAEELYGLKTVKLYHDKDDRRRFIKKIASAGFVHEFEVDLKRKDNSKIFCLLTVNMRKSADGEIVYQGIIHDMTVRKKAQKALTESESKFRNVVSQASEGIILFDTNGIITEWNFAQEKITGISRFDAIGKGIWEAQYLMTPTRLKNYLTIDKLKERFSDIISGNTSFPIAEDSIIELSDKSSKYIHTIVYPVTTKTNALYGIITRDVTSEKNMQQRLQHAKEEWENSFDAVPDMMALFDKDLTILRANHALAHQLDCDIKELIGKNYQDIVKEDTTLCFPKHIITDLKNNIPPQATNTCEGEFLVSTSPMFSYDNKFSGLVYIARDISKLRETEEALKTSEEKYRSIIETAFDSIFLMDKQQLIFVNQSFSDNTGYSFEELTDTNFNVNTLYSPESSAYIDDRVARRAKGEVIENPFRVQMITKEGKKVEVEISTVELLQQDDNIILGMFHDITEQAKYEREIIDINKDLEKRVVERTKLLESTLTELQNEIIIRQNAENKMLHAKEEITNAFEKEKELGDLKTRFIEMISHEYRTPLTVILSSTYLIERIADQLQDSNLDRSLDRIRKSVKAMTDLLENVLLLGQFESHSKKINITTINIKQLLEDMYKNITIMDKDNHDISYGVDLETETFNTDANLFKLILTNLLTNALKYTAPGKKISLNVSSNEIYLTLRISDEGIGILQGDLVKIYDPFYRGKNIGVVPGIGLGLSIVKSCVDSLDADMKINSRPNYGTEFIITIPVNNR